MMRRRYLALLALFVLVASALIGGLFWYRQRMVSVSRVVAPFSNPDPLVSFSSMLSVAGVSQDMPPTILGDTITASISGVRVLFDKSQSWETQIRTLQVVLPQLKMEGKKYTEIDLRFAKVIFR